MKRGEEEETEEAEAAAAVEEQEEVEAAANSRSWTRFWREADSESLGFSSAEGLGCSVAREGRHRPTRSTPRVRKRERASERARGRE